jgi:hypothetical protein
VFVCVSGFKMGMLLPPWDAPFIPSAMAIGASPRGNRRS